jgi:uncharacterized membrane protein
MVAVRFLILRDGGAPATIDAGNWLAFGDAIFGGDARSSTIVYPPLVPILTKGFVEAFGLITGVAALGALASAAPATGFYIALRRYGLEAVVLPGALLLLGAAAVGETTAWGGFPQLIGLGLAPLMLFELDRWISFGSRGAAIRTGVLLMAVFATTHFVGSAVVAASVLMLVMGLPRLRRQNRPWQAWAIDAFLIVLPSAWLVPLYGNLIAVFSGSSESFRFLDQLTWSNVLDRIEFLYRDFPILWRIAIPLTLMSPLLAVSRRSSTVWRVLSAVLVSSAGLALVTREGRFLYFVTLAVALAVTLWIQIAWSALASRTELSTSSARALGWALLAVAVGLATWQMILGIGLFREQRDYYGILTPGLFQALELIRDESPRDVVVAVTSIRDAPLGWWVEAITDRETYYASALRWLSFEDERERARIGNQIFTRTFPDAASLAVAAEHDVDYLIIPTRWAFFDYKMIDRASDVGLVVTSTDDDVVVLRVQDTVFP